MSATFINGPAQRTVLNLERIPKFLRVVIDSNGAVDALDQPDDEPRESEKVYAYRSIFQIRGFICKVKGHKGCMQFQNAQYRMLVMQPEESILRSGKLWRKWVEEFSKEVET